MVDGACCLLPRCCVLRFEILRSCAHIRTSGRTNLRTDAIRRPAATRVGSGRWANSLPRSISLAAHTHPRQGRSLSAQRKTRNGERYDRTQQPNYQQQPTSDITQLLRGTDLLSIFFSPWPQAYRVEVALPQRDLRGSTLALSHWCLSVEHPRCLARGAIHVAVGLTSSSNKEAGTEGAP